MKAAVVGEKGVEVRDVPKPAPKPNEILIKVRAASLNRADLAVASGHRHGTVGGPGTVVGLECAGEVEAVGGEVKDFKPGDRVMSSAAGGFAEYAVTDAGPRPQDPGQQHDLRAGRLHAGGGADHAQRPGRRRPAEEGRIGADPGRQLRRRPARACRSPSTWAPRSSWAPRPTTPAAPGSRSSAATSRSTRAMPKWPDKVKEATGGKGVDLIVDQVSGGVMNQNMEAAAILGRIVNVGRLGGMKGEFNFDLHALKRIDYIGVTFRTRSARGGARHRQGGPRRPVARHRGRQAPPADRQDLPARPGRRGACAHEGQCPFWQDRPRRLTSRSRKAAS